MTLTAASPNPSAPIPARRAQSSPCPPTPTAAPPIRSAAQTPRSTDSTYSHRDAIHFAALPLQTTQTRFAGHRSTRVPTDLTTARGTGASPWALHISHSQERPSYVATVTMPFAAPPPNCAVSPSNQIQIQTVTQTLILTWTQTQSQSQSQSQSQTQSQSQSQSQTRSQSQS